MTNQVRRHRLLDPIDKQTSARIARVSFGVQGIEQPTQSGIRNPGAWCEFDIRPSPQGLRSERENPAVDLYGKLVRRFYPLHRFDLASQRDHHALRWNVDPLRASSLSLMQHSGACRKVRKHMAGEFPRADFAGLHALGFDQETR